MVDEQADKTFMRLAVQEAKRGMGRTTPNPCVGAVIVKDGNVIAKGYHKRAGTPHAEINALNLAGDAAAGADMYVTLEPCNHTGRTPPCSHAVAKSGVKRVVIGMLDPNPLVNGSGAHYLKETGIEVVTDVLADRCREINRPFLKYISTGYPLVVMKAGLSLDGRITYQQGRSGAITGSESWKMVHRLRNTLDAILVGSGTVTIDNPSLTTRLPGNKGRDPLRVILDTNLAISPEAQVVKQKSSASTWIICGLHADFDKEKRFTDRGVSVFRLKTDARGRIDVHDVLRLLGEKQLTSVLVEGGAAVHGAFLRERLVDRAHLFYAPIFAGDGGISVVHGYQAAGREDAVRLVNIRIKRYGDDISVSGDIEYP